MKNLTECLEELSDSGYKTFQANLMPTVDPSRILGVRVPLIRALAKEVAGSAEATAFLQALPHRYYEENNLHAFLIEQIKDFDTCVEGIDRFLPYVDNWATCDSMRPKYFGKHLDRLESQAFSWMKDEANEWAVRFGIEMLMNFYLGEHFRAEHLSAVAAVPARTYYIAMMEAWYFATALDKQYEKTLSFLIEGKLSPWVHEKTIRKAIESNRISPETKAYLRTFSRRKEGKKIVGEWENKQP